MCKHFVWARPSMVLRLRCKAQEMGVIQYAWSAFEMQRILNAICCYQEWHIGQWLLQFVSQPAQIAMHAAVRVRLHGEWVQHTGRLLRASH